MSQSSPPTKAQRERLEWLYRRGKTDDVCGGDLVDYYYTRWLQREGLARDMPGYTYPTTPRSHAYRRTGGLSLRRLADAGWLRRTRFHWGVPHYAFSEQALTEFEPAT